MWWILAIVGMAVTGWVFFSTTRVLFPATPEHKTPPEGISYTAHSQTTQEGRTFDVWWLRTTRPKARLLLIHGYHADRLQLLHLAGDLQQEGYESALFSLRGHEGRPGPCTLGVKEVRDAQRVIAWLNEQTASDPRPLGVLGFSMGGVIALQTALLRPEIAFVIADSPYGRFYPVLRHLIRQEYRLPGPFAWMTWLGAQLRLGVSGAQFDPAVGASNGRQPLLMIHSGRDAVVSSENRGGLFECWGGPKQEWMDPNAVHVGAYARDPKAYVSRIASFLQEVAA